MKNGKLTSEQKINRLKNEISKLEAEEKRRLKLIKKQQKEKNKKLAESLGFEVLKYEEEGIDLKIQLVGLLQFFKMTDQDNKIKILRCGKQELIKRKEQKKGISY
ncbi:hypothetical protein JNG69_18780 [Proteus mirabilis]|uniref:hypothetical protein n=1 Tax=Proteus mirabilis TaxID=584 RepID=UPI001FADD449|nr:hypothetical protein [Proteus mirabilis]MCI9740980.1 hypothetical protein [Proteus mirabilis]